MVQITMGEVNEALGDIKQFGSLSKRLRDRFGNGLYALLTEHGWITRTSYGGLLTVKGTELYNVMSRHGPYSPSARKVYNGLPEISSSAKG